MCGLACSQATANCTWACVSLPLFSILTTQAEIASFRFARDGAIPGSTWIKKVNKRFKVPLNAYILSTTIQALLGCIYFGSTAAFNAFTGGT
jgi:amino acid transporter